MSKTNELDSYGTALITSMITVVLGVLVVAAVVYRNEACIESCAPDTHMWAESQCLCVRPDGSIYKRAK